MTDLRTRARDHLWLHFTRMHGYEPPVIVRGEGCYLWDDEGKRYLDALAGSSGQHRLLVRRGDRSGRARADARVAVLHQLVVRASRAIELATELARLAPGDIDRAFFVSGGSEAVESAWKLARQYHAARGERRWKAVSRRTAYHGTTMGALSINGIPALRAPFEPLVPDVVHVRNTNRYHRPPTRPRRNSPRSSRRPRRGDRRPGRRRWRSSSSSRCRTPAARSRRPRVLPGRAGDLRPLRDPALRRRGDHRLRPRRRLVRQRAVRHRARPDHLREGPLVGVRADRRGARRRLASSSRSTSGTAMYAHGITFGGHPVQRAVALKNLEIMEREASSTDVREHEDGFRAQLATLLELDDRRRPARRGLPLGARAREGRGDARRHSRTRSPRSCCAGSSGLSSSSAVSSAAPTTGATRSSRSGRRWSRGRRNYSEMVGNLGEVLTDAWREDQLMATTVVYPGSTRRRSRKKRRASSSSRCGASTWSSSRSVAFVGLDTLGTVASNGPQGFFWLVALRCSSSLRTCSSWPRWGAPSR